MDHPETLVEELAPIIFKVVSDAQESEVLKACSVASKLGVRLCETEKAVEDELCIASNEKSSGAWVRRMPEMEKQRHQAQGGLEILEKFVKRKLIIDDLEPPTSPGEVLKLCAERGGVSFRSVILTHGLTLQHLNRPSQSPDPRGCWFQPQLLASYNVNGVDLLSIPGMNIGHLLSLNPSAAELMALGLDAQTLATRYGMRMEHLPHLISVSANEWVEGLHLTKTLLQRAMGMTVQNISLMLNSQHTQWTETHLLSMGFTHADFCTYKLCIQ